jgi:hypothetical protein
MTLPDTGRIMGDAEVGSHVQRVGVVVTVVKRESLGEV